MKQIADILDDDDGIRPGQLVLRARAALARSRELVGRLQLLAESPALRRSAADDPLAQNFGTAAAMAEAVVRFVQSFPDSPSAQMRLCEGLDGVVAATADRVGRLAAAVRRRVQAIERVDVLAHLLTGLQAGRVLALDPFTALAESVVADARQGEPLHFYQAGPVSPACDADTARDWQARHVASHGLVTAEVMARLVRQSFDWKRQPLSPVFAALVHDTGMLQVPFSVLALPGALSAEQRRRIEPHARAGADFVARHIPAAAAIAEAVAQHHERLDGTGYPTGRTEITPLARLLAVADVYAALASARPHRPARDLRTAMTDTLLTADQGGLDRAAAGMLLGLSFYPTGTPVELTDGSAAVVVGTHPPGADPHTPARPVVAVLTDGRDDCLPVPKYLDLTQSEGRSIVRQLPAGRRTELAAAFFPELIGT